MSTMPCPHTPACQPAIVRWGHEFEVSRGNPYFWSPARPLPSESLPEAERVDAVTPPEWDWRGWLLIGRNAEKNPDCFRREYPEENMEEGDNERWIRLNPCRVQGECCFKPYSILESKRYSCSNGFMVPLLNCRNWQGKLLLARQVVFVLQMQSLDTVVCPWSRVVPAAPWISTTLGVKDDVRLYMWNAASFFIWIARLDCPKYASEMARRKMLENVSEIAFRIYNDDVNYTWCL